jgi:hypothetical protein
MEGSTIPRRAKAKKRQRAALRAKESERPRQQGK